MNKFQLLLEIQNQDSQITTKPAFFGIRLPQSFQDSINPTIIKMSVKQKIINLLAISLFIYSLYFLNNLITSQYSGHQGEVSLMKTIGFGEPLDEIQIEAVKNILNVTSEKEIDSISCFFRAYEELIISKNFTAENMFSLFADGSAEYEGITDCLNYYSILIYKSLQEEQAIKNNVRGPLLDQQLKAVESKYPKIGKNAQVCLYFNSHNSESTIKAQFKHLATQIYQNSVIIIEDDASTDNSPMLIKYLMDQASTKIKFSQSKEKKGVLKGFKEALNQCSDDSIVVLLEENEAMLGDNAFYIIDRIFSNVNADLLFLGTLTTPHLNIQNVKSTQSLYSQVNPLIAVHKSHLSGLTWPETVSEDLQRSTLIYQLTHQKNISMSVVNEALIYRQQRKTSAYLDKIQRLSSMWK